MSIIYLSKEAHPLLRQYLLAHGHRCIIMPSAMNLPFGISSHPDLFLCKMGCQKWSPVFLGDLCKLKAPYPHDTLYNAACTGKYFIHRLQTTDIHLYQFAVSLGMELIQVRQGYSKCNIIVVDENTIITSDAGIYHTLQCYKRISCQLISGGNVHLAGYPTGFIGGASGRIGNQIIFHGALNAHPDFNVICNSIRSKGLEPVWFEEFPLTDIGSIIEVPLPFAELQNGQEAST